MVRREPLAEVGELELQLAQRPLHPHGALEHRLRLLRDGHRALVPLERIHGRLGRVDARLQLRQLRLEERQHLRGLRELPIHVSPHVDAADRVQDVGDALRFDALERRHEYVGLLPGLLHAQRATDRGHQTRAIMLHHEELRTRPRDELPDDDLDPARRRPRSRRGHPSPPRGLPPPRRCQSGSDRLRAP